MTMPSGSWVFSTELSSEELTDIQGMIAASGLSTESASLSEGADAAFARMVAANPNAQVIGGPDVAAVDSSAADEAFARMMVAYPNATVIGSPATSTDAEDADAAFARMVAANPNAQVIGGPAVAAVDSSAADEAFARMIAAYPNATVIGSPPASMDAAVHAGAAEDAYQRFIAEHPDMTVIRGPAGGGVLPATSASGSTWRFSSDLSDERRAEIMGMIGMAGLGASPSISESDQAAADAAFDAMVAAQPGAREIAPGVFSASPEPAEEQ